MPVINVLLATGPADGNRAAFEDHGSHQRLKTFDVGPVEADQQLLLSLLQYPLEHAPHGVGGLDAFVGAESPAPLDLVLDHALHGPADVGQRNTLDRHMAEATRIPRVLA
jgi:hypothetical protein